jgi:hypothetical protein
MYDYYINNNIVPGKLFSLSLMYVIRPGMLSRVEHLIAVSYFLVNILTFLVNLQMK